MGFLLRGKCERRREGVEREVLTFVYDLRRSGGCLRTGQGLKSEYSARGYVWILETPSFAKVSCERFEKSKALGLGSVRGTSSGRCSRFKK